MDTTRPTASGSASNITSASSSTHSITVEYRDNVAVDASDIGTGDIQVTGPNAFSQTATFVSVSSSSDGTPKTGTYRITAPGGSWDAADNGTYTVSMIASQVSDTSDNFVAAGVLGTFQSVALPAIDFDDVTIRGYAVGSQDFSGGITVLPGGNGIELNGNHWKAIDFVYTVTPNTILEFDFESSREGEIHGIGFDTDVNLHGINSQPDFFQLYGTQGWGRQDFHDYTPPDSEHYRIPVGQFLTGSFNHLVFVQDHDIRSADAQSIFQNVRVFED